MQENSELVDSHHEWNVFHGLRIWVFDAKSQINKRLTDILETVKQRKVTTQNTTVLSPGSLLGYPCCRILSEIILQIQVSFQVSFRGEHNVLQRFATMEPLFKPWDYD